MRSLFICSLRIWSTCARARAAAYAERCMVQKRAEATTHHGWCACGVWRALRQQNLARACVLVTRSIRPLCPLSRLMLGHT